MVRNEVHGVIFACVAPGQPHTVYSNGGKNCPVTEADVLKFGQYEGALSVPANIAVLIVWIICARMAGYFALKLLHRHHKPKRRENKSS